MLVFNLVVQPLLVVCIREGGRVLVEVAGRDTCHEESGQGHLASSTGSGRTPGVAAGEWYDPCLDLSLYRPASAPRGADLTPQMSDGAALGTGISSCSTLPAGYGAAYEPPPKLLPASSDPAYIPLRI